MANIKVSDVSDSAEKKWNEIYSSKISSAENLDIGAAEVLTQHKYLLPKTGVALDLACGLGANAIFLAKHGLNTTAWDISEVVINKLQSYSQDNDLDITCETRDVEKHPPASSSFDVICISYYLERKLSDSIIKALKPNGLLLYQTFTTERVSDAGPNNPKFRLQENELLRLFSSLHVLAYQECGEVGDVKYGLRDVAMLVAQKR